MRNPTIGGSVFHSSVGSSSFHCFSLFSSHFDGSSGGPMAAAGMGEGMIQLWTRLGKDLHEASSRENNSSRCEKI